MEIPLLRRTEESRQNSVQAFFSFFANISVGADPEMKMHLDFKTHLQLLELHLNLKPWLSACHKSLPKRKIKAKSILE